MILRDYQKKILNDKIIVDILRHIEGKKERPEITSPLVVSPTGSGKTAMFCAIAKFCQDRGLRVIILVHREEILKQTLKSMFRLGITCGQIAAGKPITKDLIQVASVRSLISKLGIIYKPNLIVTDEAHHTTEKNTWGKIHKFWSTVPNIGFTATPQRLDGVGLGLSYQKIIMGPSVRWLVDHGYLAFPITYRPENEISADYHITRGDFDTKEQQETMSKKQIVGDVINEYKKHLDGLPVIVACVSIDHARLMAARFESEGYRSKVVWGGMTQTDREYAIDGLGNGNVQVVTFCDLIGEGVDIPVLAGIILLRRTASLALYLQWVGRALRMYEGKHRAIIIDHANNYKIHKSVLIERQWSLDSQRRKKNDPEPVTTTCPKCYGIWPGKPIKCPDPDCGFLFKSERQIREEEIKVIAGNLVNAGFEGDEAEAAAGFIDAAMRADPKIRQKMLLQRTFALATEGDKGRDTIKELARAVGYKNGWIDWAWKYAQGELRKKETLG